MYLNNKTTNTNIDKEFTKESPYTSIFKKYKSYIFITIALIIISIIIFIFINILEFKIYTTLLKLIMNGLF